MPVGTWHPISPHAFRHLAPNVPPGMWAPGTQSPPMVMGTWHPMYPHACGHLVPNLPPCPWVPGTQSPPRHVGIWHPTSPHAHGHQAPSVPPPPMHLCTCCLAPNPTMYMSIYCHPPYPLVCTWPPAVCPQCPGTRLYTGSLALPNESPFAGLPDLQGKGDWEGRWGKQYQQGLQLYDTPYEEQERDPEGGPASPARESRLPQDDERPADEYDQPWEWKKDHISRAFAVQFENPDWERPSSLNKERRRPPKHLTAGPKHGRSQSPERSPPVAERVDPSLPLEKQVWYHGSISRADAETLLTLCKEGSYLVRNSETSHHDYSLSLRSTQGFMHMKFTRTRENKYVLGQNSAPFESIPEVIHYYTVRELPVKGAEQLSLLYPVAVQTL
uniref:Src homology 2 domain containing transforming protein D n=1 Tax=Chrysemys picta bellii TaxID=8478 RepID=A0A8C3FWT2_CHRPI